MSHISVVVEFVSLIHHKHILLFISNLNWFCLQSITSRGIPNLFQTLFRTNFNNCFMRGNIFLLSLFRIILLPLVFLVIVFVIMFAVWYKTKGISCCSFNKVFTRVFQFGSYIFRFFFPHHFVSYTSWHYGLHFPAFHL